MNDNCDMNLFNPENMEIKPGKIGSFIPKYSKLIVSERDDSTCCIEFEIAGRDYEFNMSKEQAVKLARGIFSLSGEERPQGELKEYKPLEPDYNVQCAVENLKTAYWSNDSEKFAKVFTDAEEIIVSAICHHGYSVCKQPQGQWIPIKTRPGTDEEYEEFSQYGDCPREDFRVFECQLPNDDQEVLVTTRWGNVCIDIWHRDVDCCYFEDNSDADDVIAWMPLPEPYKKGGEEE